MPLISMKPMLAVAREEGYAVGAFNAVDYLSCKAVIQAAEKLNAPVIIQTSVKTVKFWGHSAVVSWMKNLAEHSPIPVALHLDHCKDVGFIQQCIDAGWTSVMIDASSLPYEENLAMTEEVVRRASAKNIGVEAELGEIGGVEEDIIVAEEDAHLADPDKAIAFCEKVSLAVFAPAIGTAHGVYKGKPKIAFDRLEKISSATPTPLALHGGTGLSDEVFKRCISLGCSKVNISTELKHVFIESFVDFHLQNKIFEPLKPLDAQLDAIESAMAAHIVRFGGEGRASKDAVKYQ
ncbi:MAG: class II fructose-bisphosphate aldolase [Candidatus Hinthialibacter antarcticus]|nr:class II fructose-bisphosphate aldolase [Candidatus Hinthialibacter antarcticus]